VWWTNRRRRLRRAQPSGGRLHLIVGVFEASPSVGPSRVAAEWIPGPSAFRNTNIPSPVDPTSDLRFSARVNGSVLPDGCRQRASAWNTGPPGASIVISRWISPVFGRLAPGQTFLEGNMGTPGAYGRHVRLNDGWLPKQRVRMLRRLGRLGDSQELAVGRRSTATLERRFTIPRRPESRPLPRQARGALK